MKKTQAIELLGGTVSAAAKAMGVSYQAVDKWPDELPNRIAERVMGVYARDRLPELAKVSTIDGGKSAEGVGG